MPSTFLFFEPQTGLEFQPKKSIPTPPPKKRTGDLGFEAPKNRCFPTPTVSEKNRRKKHAKCPVNAVVYPFPVGVVLVDVSGAVDRPMLQLRGAEVTRLGDLHRNWAKVQQRGVDGYSELSQGVWVYGA